jgi:hypothetical protein
MASNQLALEHKIHPSKCDIGQTALYRILATLATAKTAAAPG